MKRTLIIVLISILTMSCNFTSHYLDRESDKNDAEKVTSDFFRLIKNSNYDQTLILFSDEFYKVTTKEQLFEIYSVVDKKLGKLNNTELIEWSTNVSEGEISQGLYQMKYGAEFEKDDAKIIMTLIKNKEGKIKVNQFHIDSNVFLN